MKNYIIRLIKDYSIIERQTYNDEGEMCSLPEPNYILDDDDIVKIAEEIENKLKQKR